MGGDLKEAGGNSKLVLLYPNFYLLKCRVLRAASPQAKVFLLVWSPIPPPPPPGP